MDLVGRSFALGESILSNRSPKQLKSLGQFLTPPVVACYLARQLSTIKDGDRILDPSIGSGVLACAVIEEIIQVYRYQDAPIELWLEGYEIDSELAQAARDMLALATEYAAMHGIILHTRVYEEDFILSHVSLGPLFGTSNSLKYDCIIANPPYFKLNKEDPRVRAVMAQSSGYTNIYTLFIAFSIEQLQPSARACFIVPRSFCSGAYFSDFREDFIEKAVPLAVHLFESRDTVFGQRNVLQENIIVTFRRRNTTEVFKKSFPVAISTSRSATNLDSPLLSRDIDTTLFLGKINGSLFFRLPISELDENILRTVDSWPGSFSKYGLKVSTGPVVAFRAKNYLTSGDDVDNGTAVPLLWMQNVQPGHIKWPVIKKNKPQGILSSAGDKLLVPLENYVLIRRFSSKEEPRRLISAPLIARQFTTSGNLIGLENHLNYIYHKNGNLAAETAVGLSTLFNSALIDRYFRILSGNTQVNATELRALPLPPLSVITELGYRVMQSSDKFDLDTITFSVLREMGCLSLEFPTIRESRITN